MKKPIDSPEKAVSYQDYKGKRYYFCCGMCPGKFKENPELYAKAN
ncbi:MAG: YHS domain-containing protein [Armatimonadetes bacterium]|nr:YHS domain-containing protein [Armatimonadota bacterium]